jgi:hypothetical protein
VKIVLSVILIGGDAGDLRRRRRRIPITAEDSCDESASARVRSEVPALDELNSYTTCGILDQLG